MNRLVLAQSQAGFPAENDETWYSALETLKTDASLRASMAAKGRMTALARYDTPVVGQLIAEVFTNVLACQ